MGGAAAAAALSTARCRNAAPQPLLGRRPSDSARTRHAPQHIKVQALQLERAGIQQRDVACGVKICRGGLGRAVRAGTTGAWGRNTQHAGELRLQAKAYCIL